MTDVSLIAARPGFVPADAPPAVLASLATLPGPSPLVLAGLLPAAVLLAAGQVLGRLGDPDAARHRWPEGGQDGAHPLRLAAGRLSDVAFVAFVASILALSALPGLVELAGGRLVTITSGSMIPAYPPGAMVLVRALEPSLLAPGDVVVFSDDAGRTRTHRIASVGRDADGPAFVTRGDAIPWPDGAPVPAAAILGRVDGSLPWLGALRAWVFSPAGIFAALLVGAILARGTATRRS